MVTSEDRSAQKNKGNDRAILQGMLCFVAFSTIFPAEAKITMLKLGHLSRVHKTVREKDILSF
jgi:hypothetical protein